MNTENRNMDGYDSLLESLKEIAGQMKGLTDMAVVQFTPWVNDICSRKATKNEVEQMNACCNCSG